MSLKSQALLAVGILCAELATSGLVPSAQAGGAGVRLVPAGEVLPNPAQWTLTVSHLWEDPTPIRTRLFLLGEEAVTSVEGRSYALSDAPIFDSQNPRKAGPGLDWSVRSQGPALGDLVSASYTGFAIDRELGETGQWRWTGPLQVFVAPYVNVDADTASLLEALPGADRSSLAGPSGTSDKELNAAIDSTMEGLLNAITNQKVMEWPRLPVLEKLQLGKSLSAETQHQILSSLKQTFQDFSNQVRAAHLQLESLYESDLLRVYRWDLKISGRNRAGMFSTKPVALLFRLDPLSGQVGAFVYTDGKLYRSPIDFQKPWHKVLRDDHQAAFSIRMKFSQLVRQEIGIAESTFDRDVIIDYGNRNAPRTTVFQGRRSLSILIPKDVSVANFWVNVRGLSFEDYSERGLDRLGAPIDVCPSLDQIVGSTGDEFLTLSQALVVRTGVTDSDGRTLEAVLRLLDNAKGDRP